jgi:predicted ATPase/class 3 adenylate cyclase
VKPRVELPSGTVTFLVVDVAFAHAVPRSYVNWVHYCHKAQELIDSLVDPCGGAPVTSRGSVREYVYAFSRATKAIEAAVGLQKHTRAGTVPSDDAVPHVRCSVFTGEVDLINGAYSGFALEQAIALKNLAHSGQILVSLSTQELVRSLSDNDVEFQDLGSHQLQENVRSERVFQAEAPGLPSRFPPLRSVDSALTNVPFPTNSFVGREKQLFELIMHLRAARLVTVSGPAGIGKSRLVLQLAVALLHEYRDGVFTVDMGSLTNGSFIAETIATALPFVDLKGGDLRPQLRDALSTKQVLIIIDNCDNVAEALADQMPDLVGGLRTAEVILTCRKPTGASGELVYSLGPLELVAESEGTYSPAFALLRQRVQDLVPGHSMGSESEADANKICRLLRGIPLCMEMVAAKFKVSPIEDLVRQIEGFTEESESTRPQDLQPVVDGTLNWILQSLPTAEQEVLTRLAAFSGGWESDAPEQVCADSELAAVDIRNAIELLVQKGLVERSKRGPHVVRDRLSRSVWQFCFARTVNHGLLLPLRERHLEWCLSLADIAAEGLVGADQHRLMERTEREKENFRSAIEWCLNGGNNLSDAFRLVFGIHMFWYKRGYLTEGRIWLERLLAAAPFEANEDRARALNILGVFMNADGDTSGSTMYLEHALSIARSINSDKLIGSILNNIGLNYRGQRNLDKARAAFSESGEVFRKLGDEPRLATLLSNLGAVLSEQGNYDAALIILDESLHLNKRLDNEWAAIMVAFNMAELAIRQNHLDRAEPLLSQSLTRWFHQKDYRGVALALRAIANVADKLGQGERAAVLLGASASIRDRLHQDLPPIEMADYQALVAKLNADLGEAQFYRKWTEGNGLSTDAAVQFALGNVAHRAS